MHYSTLSLIYLIHIFFTGAEATEKTKAEISIISSKGLPTLKGVDLVNNSNPKFI